MRKLCYFILFYCILFFSLSNILPGCYNKLPCCRVRNSALHSCLALLGKYFSRNLLLKLVQVTSSSRVCFCYILLPGLLLCLGALYYPEYFLAFSKPCVCLVWGGFPSELRWLMAHKVFHRHRSDRWNHGSRLRCHRLHRIYHLVGCIRNLISSNNIPTSPVCHSLCTPHSSVVNIEQLKILTGSISC